MQNMEQIITLVVPKIKGQLNKRKKLTKVIEYPDFTSLKSSTSSESKYLKI